MPSAAVRPGFVSCSSRPSASATSPSLARRRNISLAACVLTPSFRATCEAVIREPSPAMIRSVSRYSCAELERSLGDRCRLSLPCPAAERLIARSRVEPTTEGARRPADPDEPGGPEERRQHDPGRRRGARADREQEHGDRDEGDQDRDRAAREDPGDRWQEQQQPEDRRLCKPRQERVGAATRGRIGGAAGDLADRGGGGEADRRPRDEGESKTADRIVCRPAEPRPRGGAELLGGDRDRGRAWSRQGDTSAARVAALAQAAGRRAATSDRSARESAGRAGPAEALADARGASNAAATASGASATASIGRRARCWYSGPCFRGSAYSRGFTIQYSPDDGPYQDAPLQVASPGSRTSSYEVEPIVALRTSRRRPDRVPLEDVPVDARPLGPVVRDPAAPDLRFPTRPFQDPAGRLLRVVRAALARRPGARRVRAPRLGGRGGARCRGLRAGDDLARSSAARTPAGSRGTSRHRGLAGRVRVERLGQEPVRALDLGHRRAGLEAERSIRIGAGVLAAWHAQAYAQRGRGRSGDACGT